MDSEIKNGTCMHNRSAFSISISIFIFVIQGVYSTGAKELLSLSDNQLLTLVMNILFSGLIYYIINRIVLYIYSTVWIIKHKSIYLAGVWMHIHVGPNKSDHLRVGEVQIRQNFYDLYIDAYNYTPVIRDGKIVRKDRNLTFWHHVLSTVDSKGHLSGFYRTENKFTDTRGNKGIHELQIASVDSLSGFSVMLAGVFADVYPSDSEGYTFWFRRSVRLDYLLKRISLTSDMKVDYKDEWEEETKLLLDDIRKSILLNNKSTNLKERLPSIFSEYGIELD